MTRDWLEVLPIGRVHPVEQRLDVALDHGERGPQLMRHVGQRRLALLLHLLESAAHRVERAGQRADFARTLLRHADAEIARFHPA